MDLRVIAVPYRYDEAEVGLGAGPRALLEAGLLGRLREAGVSVGDAAEARLADDERVPDRVAVNVGRIGRATAALVATARRDRQPVLVLAGDDTAAVGIVAGVQRGGDPHAAVGIVWFDAHGDFNTPRTSVSGILAGMPLAVLAGLTGPDWRAAAGLLSPVATDRMLLAGIRDLDDQEATLLRASAAAVVRADGMRKGDAFAAAVADLAERCTVLCVHVDLDVLDPRHVPSASTPSAGGLTVDDLTRAVSAVLTTGKVATVAVTSLNPGAGALGAQSVANAAEFLVRTLPHWQGTPGELPE